jgi:hypothetical protein
MGWSRTRLRWTSALALAAMALQLVLSFGHVHLESLAGRHPTAIVADATWASSFPVQNSDGDVDDYCAICAAIHLASTSFLPDAPRFQIPAASQAIEHFSYAVFIFVAPQRTLFRSRAPPLA